MQRWEFGQVGEDFGSNLENVAAELGLTSERHDLKSLPANHHWHFRKPGEKGTLEATWLLEKRQAWLSCHTNRRADWVAPTAEEILGKIAWLK